jgi:hypothetical protein
MFVALSRKVDTMMLREAMFVALSRKVDTMLPRANLARVEPNRSGYLSRGKEISVCCALSVEKVLWRSGVSFAAKWRTRTASINSLTRLPRFDVGHEHGKQMNELAAHEELRAVPTL